MRRSVLIDSVGTVLETLDSSGVAAILMSAVQQPAPNRKRPSAAETVRRFHEFAAAAGQFDDAQHQVLSAFELDTLLDTNTWLAFAMETEGTSPALQRSLNYKFRTFRAYAPKVLSMVENAGLKLRREAPEDQATLTVLLPVGEHFLDAERLTKAIGGIEKLYGVCAQLLGAERDELRVVSADSGVDFSFDFLGRTEVIALLHEVLHSIWERVVYHRHLEVSERIPRVADTVPVLHRITRAAESGEIEREQAEILRRRVVAGATAFLEAGALLEAFDQPVHDGARALMATSQLMLQGPQEGAVEEPEVTEVQPLEIEVDDEDGEDGDED